MSFFGLRCNSKLIVIQTYILLYSPFSIVGILTDNKSVVSPVYRFMNRLMSCSFAIRKKWNRNRWNFRTIMDVQLHNYMIIQVCRRASNASAICPLFMPALLIYSGCCCPSNNIIKIKSNQNLHLSYLNGVQLWNAFIILCPYCD